MQNTAPAALLARKSLNERLLFKALVLLTFPAFLLAALVAAVVPRDTSSPQRWSVLQQARAASNSTIPFVFMG